MIKKVKEKKEYYIDFTDEELVELGFEKNQQFEVELLDDKSGIQLIPFVKMDIDLGEFDRDTLEYLIKTSVEENVSVNDVINDHLTSYLNTLDRE